MNLTERDADGILHVVALSGGHDSTCLALMLKDKEPRPYNYVCTPTGNELPEMFNHWNNLSEILGRRIIPITGGSLEATIRKQNMLPNFRRRFCTRIIKILPFRKFLQDQLRHGPIVTYVGLRADEPGRAGGAYESPFEIETRYPLREWNMSDPDVLSELERRGVEVPRRTDCAICYHQRIGEWYLLWKDHPEEFQKGVLLEEEFNQTLRTPGRDSWPSSLKEMREEFKSGRVPNSSLKRMETEQGLCRVCSL